jgi:large conductance mechanosensitive channel
MFKGFRDFILRGNVVDLAVAVLIGAAFGAITSSLTTSIITPFISALVGSPDFSTLVFHMPVLHAVVPPNPLPANYIAPGEIHYGIFLNALINFIIVAFVIYFLIVLPVKSLLARVQAKEEATTKECPQCLSEVPLAATRCKFCTQAI